MWCWLVAILDELIQTVVIGLTTVYSPLMCAELFLHSKYSLPSGTAVRVWLFSLSDGLNLVRSLKLQLFCTLAGLPLISSDPPTTSLPGEQRWRSLMDVCRLFMLWPRGLAIRTRSLKLNFWLQGGLKEKRERETGREGVEGCGKEKVREKMIQRKE